MESHLLNKIVLDENSQENIHKKTKPDYESIVLYDQKLILLGSGSTANRNGVKTYDLKSKLIKNLDYKSIYEKFKNCAALTNNDLNIEGLIINNDMSYFFQRGNSSNSCNGIFCCDSKTDTIRYINVVLPQINNIESTFTDAILVDDTIYFLASVENTTSTYYDGEILGTFVGKIKLSDCLIEETQLISNKHKFEGITLYKTSKNEIEFLLCEDNDSTILEADIYKLIIQKSINQ
tara:strand:- start:663 stop:1367 length:705 start_codon:yes stop_codon:yes gene_type:complete